MSQETPAPEPIDFGLPSLREPIEVYLAAVGEPNELIARLRSDAPLGTSDREALALLFEGKLVPEKRKRGRPLAHERHSNLINPYGSTRLGVARAYYEGLAERLKRRGCFYGNADRLAAAIARKMGLDQETFLTFLRRDAKRFKPPQISLTLPERFQAWCRSRESNSRRK